MYFMPKQDSHFQRHEIFTAAAAIAAHANFPDANFRQRDFRFLLDLFSNWVESSLSGSFQRIQNTQIQRYLERLVEEGYAKRAVRSARPAYRLTRIGLLELLTRLSDRTPGGRPEHFLFLFYFLSNYGPRIVEVIRKEGSQFPPAMRLEIETLLDCRRLLRDEIAAVERELEKLRERRDSSLRSAEQARQMFAKDVPFPEVTAEIERRYPYDLNSQKPLSTLLQEVPKDLAQWELEIGNRKRPEQIWNPQISILKHFRQELVQLLDTIQEKKKSS